MRNEHKAYVKEWVDAIQRRLGHNFKGRAECRAETSVRSNYRPPRFMIPGASRELLEEVLARANKMQNFTLPRSIYEDIVLDSTGKITNRQARMVARRVRATPHP